MRSPSLSPANLLTFLSLIISLISASVSSTSQTYFYKGSSLSVEDESSLLVSSDKAFTSGFYKVGTNAYCFAIWFTNSANKTVVWMANRDRPVNGHGSRISLHQDGNMVLTDVNGLTAWDTETSSTDVAMAKLLDSGNLVLTDLSGKVLWQSFDNPTDTFLPKQPITKGKKLISARAEGDFSSGYFHFYFDNDNVLRLMYDGPYISSRYWPDPDKGVKRNGRTNFNSSKYAILDEMGRFSSSDKLQFDASDMGFGIQRRLTLDYDGNLRLYSLNESNGLWSISWAAIAQGCTVHGLCGKYGLCVYTPAPKCSCPPGYEMADPSNWNQGCKPKFNRSCDPQNVKFVELRHSEYYWFDLNHTREISFESCKKICLEDCSCEAFQYRFTGTGECYPKIDLYNGYRSPHFQASMYIKQPKDVEYSETSALIVSEPICKSTEDGGSTNSSTMYERGSTKYANFFWFVLVLGVIDILFVASGWFYLFRNPGVPTPMEEGFLLISSQFRRFTYAELEKATKKFKEELGRGSSGAVYKGVLDDQRLVGVKKLQDVIQGEEEFWAEVSTIGRINHMNLVRTWGYCSEGMHRLLVSEFVENGSLDNHLFSDDNSGSKTEQFRFLEWRDRFKIAIGTAKGLAYLHHECLEWVIHCDVKPENILVGSNFEPKIADFGLAKLSQRGKPGSNFSTIRGTKGYIAPEWTLNLPITAKVDVYSYGVVILEIVQGSRFSNWVGEDQEEVGLRSFVIAAKEKTRTGEETWVEDFVDFRLKGQFNWKQAAAMVEIGILCVEEDRSRRPTMDMIVQTLLKCDDEASSYPAECI